MAFLTVPDCFWIARNWLRGDLPDALDIADCLADIPAGLSAPGVPALSLGRAAAIANLALAFSPRDFGPAAVRNVHRTHFRAFFLKQVPDIIGTLDTIPACPGKLHPFFQGYRDVLVRGMGCMGGRGHSSLLSREEEFLLTGLTELARILRLERKWIVTYDVTFGIKAGDPVATSAEEPWPDGGPGGDPAACRAPEADAASPGDPCEAPLAGDPGDAFCGESNPLSVAPHPGGTPAMPDSDLPVTC